VETESGSSSLESSHMPMDQLAVELSSIVILALPLAGLP
jgi:hypothetical protein